MAERRLVLRAVKFTVRSLGALSALSRRSLGVLSVLSGRSLAHVSAIRFNARIPAGRFAAIATNGERISKRFAKVAKCRYPHSTYPQRQETNRFADSRDSSKSADFRERERERERGGESPW